MRKNIKKVIRRCGELWNESLTRNKVPTVTEIITERARRDSADFLETKLDSVVLLRSVSGIRDYAINNIGNEGLILEFGVFGGNSIRRFARALSARGDERTIFGFDSFEGLEENWSGIVGGVKSKFSTQGKLPPVPQNVRLIKGWVQDTLPDFLNSTEDEPIAFIHCDLDTYTPTRFVLENVRDRCLSGTTILFDELYGYPNWRQHEYRALTETFREEEYEYVAFTDLQCVIRVR